ncbi:MAG TPA: amidase [Planctomycetaceae bacterium]|nr:amidase [Planctomycetaceae bacterium]
MQLVPERRLTIIEAAAALARGELTCERLVQGCLERIDAWEDEIHAWVSVDRDGAQRTGRACDVELARRRLKGSSEPLPPLFGIPIGIKDIIDIAEQITGAGSRARREGPPAERDATVVRMLREAGAIILGKTVTTQFACFDPPPTRNPWNVKRTPGGSSSGSAAAVAAGMCLGAIGSQTGGSIIRPASFCGVAGCKPTFGRVSLDGIVPVAPSLDTVGPIAGCVADLAILLNVISVGDQVVADGEPTLKLAIDVAGLQREKLSPPRLAVLGGFFKTADDEMRLALDRAVSQMRAAGASIDLRDIHPDWLHSHRVIAGYEMAARHRERIHKLRFDYAPTVAQLIQEGLLITDAEYAEARRNLVRAIAESAVLMEEVDALVCPAARGPAPVRTTTGDPSLQSFWTYTGQPTITFPIGFSERSFPLGLPLGIQLIGRRFDEAGLFRVAAWCEAVLPQLAPKEAPKDSAG